MSYLPKHLTGAQIDQIYLQELQNLEAMQLRAQVAARRFAAFGPDRWDTERGEELIAAVCQEWQESRGSGLQGRPPEEEEG